MKVEAALLLLLAGTVTVNGFAAGPPIQACNDIYPVGHLGPSLDLSTNPFQLSLSEFDQSYAGELFYIPGQQYQCE